jgi:hypothetical protein
LSREQHVNDLLILQILPRMFVVRTSLLAVR